MAAPGRAMRDNRLTPGELYRRHVQRRKTVALIAGLLLLPVSIFMIASFDNGPFGRAFAELFGLNGPAAPTPISVAAAPSPTTLPCRDTVFNGLISDAETDALLGGVQVTASFGEQVTTSPDGEYNILVCYDENAHQDFSLTFEKEGYEPNGLIVTLSEYPGISYQVPDVTLRPIQSATATLTPCLSTVFNGLVYDAETDALLGDVHVTASFGAEAVTSPDGEYNISVCYDPNVHNGFALTFEREGYESASLDQTTPGYPGISYQLDDMGLYSIQALTSTPTACLDTVFNGLVYDAETDALLGDVRVTASFGAEAVTSPDGEYNISVCYDPNVHNGFSLNYERDGYESGSQEVTTPGYPGISSQLPDMGLYSIQTPTATPTLFQPPRQTPLPTETPTLFQPPRQTPLPTGTKQAAQRSPTPTATLFQPPRQTPLPTETPTATLFEPPRQTPLPTETPTATLFEPPRQTPLPTGTKQAAQRSPTPTRDSRDGSATPGPDEATPTMKPPNTLPVTGIPVVPFPGLAVGFVLLAISFMLIVAGLWPEGDGDGY